MSTARMGATLALATTLLALIAGVSTASAVTPAPGFTIESFATPTNFPPTTSPECETGFLCDSYEVTAKNTGSVPTSGPVTLSDTLPNGLALRSIQLYWSFLGEENDISFVCNEVTVQCRFPVPLRPGQTLRMILTVDVEPNPPATLRNKATVSGGGAPEASVEQENGVSSSRAPFGVSNFSFYMAGADGGPDTQAGDHPNELTTSIGIDNGYRVNHYFPTMTEDVKDIVADLPLGFVGSTLAAPECPMAQLSGGTCPSDTIIGHLLTYPNRQIAAIDSPIYNLVPERGVPAEFGYLDALKGSHIFYVHVVPTPEGYVLETINPDIPTIFMDHIVVTFYGDPAAKQDELAELEGKTPSQLAEVPFFTMPSNCSGGPLVAHLYMDSWQNPGRELPDGSPDLSDSKWVSAASQSPAVTGCNALQFPAEIKAQPTTHESDKPTGLDFDIKLPQSERMGVPATPTLKTVRVTLPEGLTIDPSAGDGLGACSEAQIGWMGGSHLNFNGEPPACPEASKIGTLELETPLVPEKFTGEMFLARQNENPFGSTLAAYVVVDDPITGVLIKIAGEFLPDPHNGRLTALFDENPSLPFSQLKLHFFGGPRAELATPESCGTFGVQSELTPWSLEGLEQPASALDDFLINEACPDGAFQPSFTAGSLNLQAGAYTPFVASFSRSDTDQELAGLEVKLPPGLIANLSNVALCSEHQVQEAREGKQGCPESSQVGTVEAGAGPGPNPLFVPGKAYLTGPYNGGPYGLAVVVPAIAGPFDFGTVVVRQSIRVDRDTAQVSDVSDAFPTIIDGIPLRIRRIDVRLERPGFTFNPTNCSKLAFSGTVSGFPLGAPTTLQGTVGYATQAGASSTFSTPFQVTNCSVLGFKPSFQVRTNAHHTRTEGTSLHVKLTYPAAPFGSQANIAKVRVELPKQLPSRLTTLQKACPDTVFNSNPDNCPAASRVGEATATTPIIPEPFKGPAYFVSHGGAKFPELIIALHGYALTVYLHGETYISKEGVTSTTFNTVPDVPIGSFDLTLPAGPDSALTGNGDLCASPLLMPTSFMAQNGMAREQKTQIAVEGCTPRIRVIRHRVSGKHATVWVRVPGPGTLIAHGGGVSRASKRVPTAGTVTLTLRLSKAEQRFVARHGNRRLMAPITLSFKPSHGRRLQARVAVLMR